MVVVTKDIIHAEEEKDRRMMAPTLNSLILAEVVDVIVEGGRDRLQVRPSQV